MSDKTSLLAAGQQVHHAVHLGAGQQVLQGDPAQRDPRHRHGAPAALRLHYSDTYYKVLGTLVGHQRTIIH